MNLINNDFITREDQVDFRKLVKALERAQCDEALQALNEDTEYYELAAKEEAEREAVRWKAYWKTRRESEQRFRVLTSLLDYPSVAEAARHSGVSRQTLYNYLREPEFKAAYVDLKRAQIDRRRDLLHDLADTAGGILESLFYKFPGDTFVHKDSKINPLYELQVKAALRVLALANEPPPALDVFNGVSASVTVPPGGRGLAVAVSENAPESVKKCNDEAPDTVGQ